MTFCLYCVCVCVCKIFALLHLVADRGVHGHERGEFNGDALYCPNIIPGSKNEWTTYVPKWDRFVWTMEVKLFEAEFPIKPEISKPTMTSLILLFPKPISNYIIVANLHYFCSLLPLLLLLLPSLNYKYEKMLFINCTSTYDTKLYL